MSIRLANTVGSFKYDFRLDSLHGLYEKKMGGGFGF